MGPLDFFFGDMGAFIEWLIDSIGTMIREGKVGETIVDIFTKVATWFAVVFGKPIAYRGDHENYAWGIAVFCALFLLAALIRRLTLKKSTLSFSFVLKAFMWIFGILVLPANVLTAFIVFTGFWVLLAAVSLWNSISTASGGQMAKSTLFLVLRSLLLVLFLQAAFIAWVSR